MTRHEKLCENIAWIRSKLNEIKVKPTVVRPSTFDGWTTINSGGGGGSYVTFPTASYGAITTATTFNGPHSFTV